MDTFHVEWCGEETSGYGGISTFILQRGNVEVLFDQETTEALDGMERVKILFELETSEYETLRGLLQNMFVNSACVFVSEA
jgi:hypothetical protein